MGGTKVVSDFEHQGRGSRRDRALERFSGAPAQSATAQSGAQGWFNMSNLPRFIVIGLGTIAALFGLTILFGSWYTIDQRERGVILRYGRLIGIATPGLNFKWPLIDGVVKISLEQQIALYNKLNTYSRDQQPADIDVSVNFRVIENGVDELYINFGSINGFKDRRITPKVLEELKTVFGRYNAATAIQERGKLNAEVRAAIIKAIATDGASPVVISDVQIGNIDFSDAYEKSIEQRMLAEVEVQRVLQNAEREKATALITVTRAKAEADAIRARAQADADAIRLRGEAQAAAIKARAEALGQNPNLVSLVQAERWDGKLPTTMLPGGAVPMLGLNR
jgi:regulator of protease activity HflC (stomatin/prohibitin superfamily)